MSVGFPGYVGEFTPPQQQFIGPQFQQQPPFIQTQYSSQQYVLTQQLPGGVGQPQIGYGQPQFGGLQQSPFGFGGQPQVGYGQPQFGGLQQSPFGFGGQPQFGGLQQSPFGFGAPPQQFSSPQPQGGPQLYVGNLWPVGQFSPQLGNQFIA